MTELHVLLDNFEGPLDLLLHLIEQDELDIYDIPIGRVTEQYLRYLDQLDLADVERAGEFLVMAATLCQIKARMLLPRPVVATDDMDLAGLEPDDPRAELVARLLAYSRFRQAAGLLADLAAGQETSFTRWQEEAPPELPAPSDLSPGGTATMADLLAAWQQLLTRRQPAPARRIAREQVTVAQCMERLRLTLRRHPAGLTFGGLFPAGASRQELVATFLAVLELLRLHEISAWQQGPLGEIHLRCRGEDG